FLWKNLRGAYKISQFWTWITNFEQQANCALCGNPESMEHILLDCNKSQPIKIIWNLAHKLWLKRETSWSNLHYRTILGCNLTNFQSPKGKRLSGEN
ncbi:hypothetical protein EDB19DRAFT_1629518, partial [Suillus lakei]